jgi:hypothetical protein
MGSAEEQELADPLTISISGDVLSDTWVGRAGGEMQADPEPAGLGTLQHPALVFLAE